MRPLPVGDEALLVEVDADADVVATYRRIRGLVERGLLPAPRDLVPAARTVLVDGIRPDTWWDAFVAAGGDEDAIADRNAGDKADDKADDGSRDLVIAVRYDGADLDEVARQWDCTVDDVVRQHQEAAFTVAFCGFAPGFAYCTSQGALLPDVARRDSPRTKVPVGAVGLAGPYCGVYPVAMPGGWQLIGSTDAVMFDVDREEPALLRPGDRVRFQAEERR